MSIKLKIATVFLCFLGVLLIGNHLVLEYVVIPSFEKLELAESERSARRVLRAIERETQTLATLAGDWGSWDDTYRFVAEPYDAYIESNLNPGTFKSLGINLLFIYDLEGRVVRGGQLGRAA